MGKLGPAPKGPFVQRTTMFSTRLRTDTRALLTGAATVANRSLSQELEMRLRQTFRWEEQERALYGDDEQTAAVIRLIGASINQVLKRASRKKKYNWLEEQWLFDDVVSAVNHVLLWFRPDGDRGRADITLSSGTKDADELIEEVRSSDTALQINQGTDRQHAAARLKQKLGGLIERPHPDDKWRKKLPPERIVTAAPRPKNSVS